MVAQNQDKLTLLPYRRVVYTLMEVQINLYQRYFWTEDEIITVANSSWVWFVFQNEHYISWSEVRVKMYANHQ